MHSESREESPVRNCTYRSAIVTSGIERYPKLSPVEFGPAYYLSERTTGEIEVEVLKRIVADNMRFAFTSESLLLSTSARPV